MELEHANGLRKRVKVAHAGLKPDMELGGQLVVERVKRGSMSAAERACVPAVWMLACKRIVELTLVDGVIAKDVSARGHVPPPLAVVVPVVRRQAAISASIGAIRAYQRAHVTNSRKPSCASGWAG